MTEQPRKNTAAENPAKKDNKQLDTQALGFNSALNPTKQMENPYLATNGESYNKSEIDAKRSPLKKTFKKGTYPNAVLKQAMETYTQHQKKLADTLVAIEAAEQQLTTQSKEMQQLDRCLTTVSPGDLTWQQIQPTKVEEAPANKEIKATRAAWEAIEHSFNCAYSTDDVMTDPIFCVNDSTHYNAEADGRSYKVFLAGKTTIPNLHFKKTIAMYPRDLAPNLIAQLQELAKLQQQLLQNASVLTQKKEFLAKMQPAVAAPTAIPARPPETPGGPKSSPYQAAAPAVAPVSAPQSLRTPGAPEPSPYRPDEKPNWKKALDAVDGNGFAKLIETADSKELTTKIDGLSLAEYLALYSPWPPLPLEGNKHLPNKKALLHKLLSKKVELAPLLKAATLGDHTAVNTLMKKKPKPNLQDSAGRHFLHYAVLNDFYNKQEPSPHKVLIAEWRKQFPDEIASGEHLLAQQRELLKDPELLFQAIQKGDQAAITRLLEAKISPNVKNSEGNSPLTLAMESKHTEVVKTLVAANAIVNVEGEELEPGQVPLHFAVISSQNDILNILLTANADVKKQVKDKNTALHLAARVGNIDGINMLLEAKASLLLDAVDKNGYTPLHTAARLGSCPAIEVLIKHKANIDSVTGTIISQRTRDSGVTPLFAAAEAGQDDAVRLLITKKANMNIATKTYAFTPLFRAIMQSHVANPSSGIITNGHQLAAVHLINARANIDAISAAHTPLLMAVGNQDLALVTKLIRARAAPNARAQEGGDTPLGLALKNREFSNNAREIANLLSKTAAELQQQPLSASVPNATPAVDQKTSTAPSSTSPPSGNTDRLAEIGRNTPLGVAVKKNEIAKVKELLADNADVNQRSAGNSPVLLAINNNHPEILQELIDAKANISIEGEDLPLPDQSPLHFAALHSKNDALFVLLAAKADIKKRAKNKDTTKDTALHLAALQGNVPGVRMLLKAKASAASLREATNSDGFTPLHVAAREGNFDVVELLIQSKADINALSKNIGPHVSDESVTPLLAAAMTGKTEVTRQLIAKKADMEIATKKHHFTPLIAAILTNQRDAAIALIDAKANLSARTVGQETPLYIAVMNKNVILIHKLLTARANPNIPARQAKTPLELASELSRLNPQDKPIENLLREALKPPEQPQSASSSTLRVTRDQKTLATQSSRSAPAPGQSQPSQADLASRSLTEAFRKKRSDRDHDAEPKPDTSPQPALEGPGPSSLYQPPQAIAASTPRAVHGSREALAKSKAALFYALARKDLTTVRRLLEDKVNPNMKHTIGDGEYTALYVAVDNEDANLVEALLAAKASANTASHGGITPLYFAAQRGHIGIINILLRHKANINVVVSAGSPPVPLTPLCQAARMGHAEVVTLLIAQKAEIEAVPGSLSPLTLAIMQGHRSVVQSLIMGHANVESATPFGGNQLYSAVENGQLSIASLLIKAKAQPHTPTSRGTALALAVKMYNSVKNGPASSQSVPKAMVDLLHRASELQKQPSLASPSMPTLASDARRQSPSLANLTSSSMSRAFRNDLDSGHAESNPEDPDTPPDDMQPAYGK